MTRSVAAIATRLFVCAALAGGLATIPRTAYAAETPATGTTDSDGTLAEKSAKPEATALAGGGFALDFRVWQPAGHLAPKSLTVTYTWGKAGTRTVAAQRQGEHWHVEFPDQPEPNEQASLKLRYAFELSKADKAALVKAAESLARAILKAATLASNTDANPAKSEATGTLGPAPGGTTTGSTTPPTTPESSAAPQPPDFAKALNAALQPIGASADAKTLARYGTSEGDDGFAYVLGKLGVEVSPDGSYSLVPGGKLRDAAKAFRVKNANRGISTAEARLATARPDATEADCERAVGPIPIDEAHAKKTLRACGTAVDTKASKLTPVLDAAQLKSAHELKAMSEAPEPDLQGIDGPIGELSDDPRLANSYSLLAVSLARLHLQSAQITGARNAKATELVGDIETAFEDGAVLEDGSTLIEANTQPRRYDVATGAVFVAGLEDIVVPILISICPAQGCLTAKDMAWRAPNGWLRAFSIDAGIRTKTLDTQDQRQSDLISFLTGLSFNPVSVLRLSGGFYWFENAQTHHWAGQPYVGITLNVLNAAEILGSLGMGDQVGPTTQPVK